MLSCENFIRHVSVAAEQPLLTFMATRIYLKRLKKASQQGSDGVLGTPNQLFLGVLRLAVKFLDDRPLSEKYWCKRTSLVWKGMSLSFKAAKLDAMERILLQKLNWNVAFGEKELLHHLNASIHSPLRQFDRSRDRAWGPKSEATSSFRRGRRHFPSRIIKSPKKACNNVLEGYIKNLEELANSTGKALGDFENRDMDRAASEGRFR
jgi:hypothetical protein